MGWGRPGKTLGHTSDCSRRQPTPTQETAHQPGLRSPLQPAPRHPPLAPGPAAGGVPGPAAQMRPRCRPLPLPRDLWMPGWGLEDRGTSGGRALLGQPRQPVCGCPAHALWMHGCDGGVASVKNNRPVSNDRSTTPVQGRRCKRTRGAAQQRCQATHASVRAPSGPSTSAVACLMSGWSSNTSCASSGSSTRRASARLHSAAAAGMDMMYATRWPGGLPSAAHSCTACSGDRSGSTCGACTGVRLWWGGAKVRAAAAVAAHGSTRGGSLWRRCWPRSPPPAASAVPAPHQGRPPDPRRAPAAPLGCGGWAQAPFPARQPLGQ